MYTEKSVPWLNLNAVKSTVEMDQLLLSFLFMGWYYRCSRALSVFPETAPP